MVPGVADVVFAAVATGVILSVLYDFFTEMTEKQNKGTWNALRDSPSMYESPLGKVVPESENAVRESSFVNPKCADALWAVVNEGSL